MLHEAERRTATTKTVREAEQEKRRREEALAQAIGIRTLTTPSQAARPRPLCLLGNNSAERRSERGVAVHAKRGFR